MDKPKPKKRPRPTQDECMQWLRDNYPELYLKATRERDWVWIRGSRGDALFSQKTTDLKAFGFRLKMEGTHKLSDGTDAVWYHSCQGVWRPSFGHKYKNRRKYKAKSKNLMSKSDALEFAKQL